jgi:hypothetical protein
VLPNHVQATWTDAFHISLKFLHFSSRILPFIPVQFTSHSVHRNMGEITIVSKKCCGLVDIGYKVSDGNNVVCKKRETLNAIVPAIHGTFMVS